MLGRQIYSRCTLYIVLDFESQALLIRTAFAKPCPVCSERVVHFTCTFVNVVVVVKKVNHR